MWWIIAYVVQVCISLAIAVREVARPQRALAWSLLNILLPGLALVVYILLTQPLSARHKPRSAGYPSQSDGTPPSLPSQRSESFAAAIRHLAIDGPRPAKVTLLENGIVTFDVLAAKLADAKQTIDIEYYIFRDDLVGKRMIRLLCQAAERGVRVRFLRDAIGSHQLSKQALRQLAAAGVDCRVFAPVKLSKLNQVNHRDHTKIVMVDGQQALVGGINIGDEYTGTSPKYGPWRDTDMLIEGEAARQVATVFEMNFAAAVADRKAYVRGHAEKRAHKHRMTRHHGFAYAEASAELAPTPEYAGKPQAWPALVQTIESGPDRPVQRIRQAFFLAVTMAQTSICLTTPYFAPDADLSMALRTAASRGVKVRLLVPWRADHRLIAWATWTYYQPLLESGVEIYLYDNGILHAKTLTMDGEISIVGAANCDLRSFRQNYEVMSVVYDANVAAELEAQFERDLESAHRLTVEMLQSRSLFDHVREQSARLLAPML